jgi:fibronectin type 3 domain-containing protein
MNKTISPMVLLFPVLIILLSGCPFLPESRNNYITSGSGNGGNSGTGGDAYETDNTKSQASQLNSIQYHTIHVRTDIDFMKITVVRDKTYNIELSEIDGFYPQVSLYHQNGSSPFFTISPFADSWNETVVYKSDLNETLYVSISSRYQADLSGSYKIGYSSVDTPMQVPADLSASDGIYENKIAVTWTATSDADTYEIYRSSDGSNFTKLGETSAASFDDMTSDENRMTTSIQYVYKVRGKKTGGTVGTFSNADTGYLKDFGKISNLSANVVNGVIRLLWTDITGAGNYRIYRAANSPSSFSLISTQSVSPYDVAGSQPEVTYYFYIIPVKNGIDGFQSNVASVSIPFTSYRPDAPAASDSIIARINIRWNPVDGATGYQLFRSENIAGPYVKIGADLGGSVSSYDDFSVTSGYYYYYRIRVIKGSSYSDYSYSDSGIATN